MGEQQGFSPFNLPMYGRMAFAAASKSSAATSRSETDNSAIAEEHLQTQGVRKSKLLRIGHQAEFSMDLVEVVAGQ
jgi:hypothetical protein